MFIFVYIKLLKSYYFDIQGIGAYRFPYISVLWHALCDMVFNV